MATYPDLYFIEYKDYILLQYGTHYKQVKKSIELLDNLRTLNYQTIIDEYFPQEFLNTKFTNVVINNQTYIKIQYYLFPIKYENFIIECLQNGLDIDKIYEIYNKVINSKNENLIEGLLENNYYKVKGDYLIYNDDFFLLDNYLINNGLNPSINTNLQFKLIINKKEDKNLECLNKLKTIHYNKCKLCGSKLIYNEKSGYCYNCELGIGLKKYNLNNFMRKI